MESTGGTRELSLLPALAEVMSVRTGTVCAVDSPGLAFALAAGASQDGAWVGFAGLPEVGWEAAADLGLDLRRTVAVPFPGEHWLSVTAAFIDVISVVIVRPPGSVSEAQAARIAARLRQRGAVLIVDGPWPRAALRLTTVRSEWSGLGAGHGHLRGRRVRLQITTQTSGQRLVTLGFPATDLSVTAVAEDTLAPTAAMVG